MPAPSATTSSGSMSHERRAAEELLHVPPHERHARRAADRDDLVDVGRLRARRPCSAWRHGPTRALDEVAHQRLELVARDRALRPDAPSGVASSTSRPRRVRQRALRALRHRQHLGADLRVRRAAPRAARPAAGRRGARRCRRRRAGCRRSVASTSKTPRAQLQDRDVEGAAAEVVDRDRALGALVRDRRPARPRSARSPGGAPRGRRAGRRPCVAWRWLSLKYAGTVMTACETGLAERRLGPALELAEHVAPRPRAA